MLYQIKNSIWKEYWAKLPVCPTQKNEAVRQGEEKMPSRFKLQNLQCSLIIHNDPRGEGGKVRNSLDMKVWVFFQLVLNLSILVWTCHNWSKLVQIGLDFSMLLYTCPKVIKLVQTPNLIKCWIKLVEILLKLVCFCSN